MHRILLILFQRGAEVEDSSKSFLLDLLCTAPTPGRKLVDAHFLSKRGYDLSWLRYPPGNPKARGQVLDLEKLNHIDQMPDGYFNADFHQWDSVPGALRRLLGLQRWRPRQGVLKQKGFLLIEGIPLTEMADSW